MKKLIIITGLILIITGLAPAAEKENTSSNATQERDVRMAWWREARFGMFVHWGLYSGLAGTWKGEKVGDRGGMEWIQQRVKADTWEYAHEAVPHFRPTEDFAKQWARLAREAGCRYVVFTSKHHDGFCLHDSAVNTYDAKDMIGRDLCKEIVDACKEEGLKVGLYHSVIDWHHPQYDYLTAHRLPHPLKGKPFPNGPRNHTLYVDYLHRQVEELMTNYGTVDIIWWDYSKEGAEGSFWRGDELTAMVRNHQPNIVSNNRLYRTISMKDPALDRLKAWNPERGDFTTPEQHVPATGIAGVDWEVCMTMNSTWGYSEHDQAWKSDEVLIQNLIDIVSKGGNYLLNIGPKGDGSVPEASLKSMAVIGRWMAVNSESIYGTTASPFEKPSWGRYTKKAGRLYAHVFQWPEDGKLNISAKHIQATQAYLLADKQRNSLKIEQAEDGLVVHLPAKAPDLIASVVAVELQMKPMTLDVMYQDDFEGDRSNWVVEQMPGGSVRVSGGKLEINDAKGCTVWFREKLEGPVMIEYEALIIKKDGPHDRGSDLNCFWMARDPESYDDLFVGSQERGGRFTNYNSLRLYYVGYGANDNTTTRFRRYPGTGEKPLLPEHDLRADEYMLTYNVPIKIQLIADGNRIAYLRDGEIIYDVVDAAPFTDGWFGFRTVHNHMAIDNFKVYRIMTRKWKEQS